MLAQRPLPPLIRRINRVILIVLAFLCVVQCIRCALRDKDEADSYKTDISENSEAVKDSLPQRILPDTLEPQHLEQNNFQAINLDHVYAQKDTGLAHTLDTYLRRYHPRNALYLVVDAKTNEILAWGERKDSVIQSTPDYLSRATFPAASLAKTITVAAAFDSKRYSTNTEVPMIGSAHTLYKRQLKVPENYRGPTVPLHLAFAKSYNPPIALIGMNVGASRLKKAASKFGFNRNYPQGVPNRSNYNPPDTGYGLAEVACGFTQETTISPLQAAAMMRAVVTRKALEIPWEKNGAKGFAPTKPLHLGIEKFSDNAYLGLRTALHATATEGTSKKYMSSRFISRSIYDDVEIGGKTGSLDGSDPEGRYDWFMGFAQSRSNPDKAIVLVIMQSHGKIRTQASSMIASLIINYWGKRELK